jgi:hypothetical protein
MKSDSRATLCGLIILLEEKETRDVWKRDFQS